MKKKTIYWILIAFFCAVFLVSGGIVLDYFLDSRNHQQTMEDLRDLHNQGTLSQVIRPTVPNSTSSGTSSVPGTSTVPSLPSSIITPTTTIPASPSDPTVHSTTTVVPTEPSESLESTPTETTQPTEPTPTEALPTVPKPTEPKPTEPEPTVPQPTFPTKPSILPELRAVYALNNDVVGWVKIDGTNIDYPVLQRKDYEDYYIDHNIYGEKDRWGSIYAEEHSDVFRPSDVVVLHGHHMADATMFANLLYFKYDWFFNSQRYVYFDTLYEHRTYQVVLVFRTNGAPSNTYPFFPFHTYSDFKNEAEFKSFMSNARKLAVKDTGAEVKYGDKLLCLSTCEFDPWPNGRLVVLAKLITN